MEELALHILDIVQNSISAKATRIVINIEVIDGFLIINIEDDGFGMDEEFLKNVVDPFVTSRTTRKVGLGVPLLKHASESSGGIFQISSKVGEGTKIKSTFNVNNVDRTPLGNIAETMVSLILSDENIDYYLVLKSVKDEFIFDTTEIRKTLGQVPIVSPDVLAWVKEYINEGIIIIFGGVLNEIIS